MEVPKDLTTLREVVIQYRGGGYSGCFWEWNFFFVDHEGETWDIHSSGRDGLDTDSRREGFLQDPGGETVYVYDVNSKEDIEELNKECNPQHAVGVVEEVNKLYEEYFKKKSPMWVICDACDCTIHGTELYPYEVSLVDWHGCGGIASQAGGKICNDCYSEKTCMNCGEYDPSDDYDNEEGYCEYCWAEYTKEHEGETVNG